MATSGTIQGTTKNSSGADRTSQYGTWISWVSNSRNITNNTSNITVSVSTQRIDSYSGETVWDLITKPTVDLKVGGAAKSATISHIDTRNHRVSTFATWTGDVTHNANGTLNLSLECSWTLPSTPLASGYISGAAALDTIPRASTISAVSGTTIGSDCTVTISRADASFTHQLWYKVGNSGWYDLKTGIGTEKVFTIDIETAKQLPNAMDGTMQLCVRTFNGTTQIGSDYYHDVTVSVPDYTLTISKIKLTGNSLLSGEYVKGKSTVTAEITASSEHGATIKSYSSTVDGKTYSGNKFTSSVLSNGSKSVSVTVTDTRGMTATFESSAFTVQDYTNPTITEFTLARQSDGTTVIATVKGSVSAVNNKNAKTIQVTLNGVTQTITSNTYSINGTTTFTNVPTDNTWTGTAKITDSYTYATKDYVLPTVAVTMDFHFSGKGIAMGKVAEEENLLDVAWKIRSGKPAETLQGFSFRGRNVIDLDSEDIANNWNEHGNLATIFYNDKSNLTTKPSVWGLVLNLSGEKGTSEVHQLWMEQPDGSLYHRGGNANGLNRWRKVFDDGNLVEYIVEQGTSGVWTYRKWNSGFAECWGYHEVSGLDISDVWGSWYVSSAVVLPSFPFAFLGTPDVHVNWESSFSAIIDGVSERDSTKAGRVYLYRPVEKTDINGRFGIYAYGKWKQGG